MTAAWAWLKRWGALVLGALLLVLGGGWLWRRERDKRLDAETRAEVNRLREKIASAKAIRKRLVEDADGQTRAIDKLDDAIASNERAIAAAHDEPLEGLSRDEIRERLRRIGYD